MDTVVTLFRLAVDGLLLRREAYVEMRDAPRPFVRGITLIVAIALLISLLGVIGDTLEWATTPDLGAIQDVVREELMRMRWFRETAQEAPGFVTGFEQGYNVWWQVFKALAPSPLNAAVNVILTPVGLVIGWLIYGLLAHVFARLLGGRASLAQTYGSTSLSASPQLFNVVSVVPYASTGAVTGPWSLMGNYLALKHGHELSPARGFLATILPFITLIVLVILLVFLAGLTVGALLGGGQ